ncbi:hypothetical protein ACM55K_15315 [Flavobacterium sp. LT1R49]|uniref:hypothetical protein n=1 Tax=Flavobacterium arabinosi TaxID=3398737 RepID=UPI003A8C84E8
MAIITIKRPPGENRTKDYEIYIDKQKAGIISDGEIKEISITNGRHLINIKIGQFYSLEITIETAENKNTTLKVVGFKNIKWIWRITIGIFALHFILKMTINYRYSTFLFLPVFLFFVYYKRLGWKKYLTLEEI